MRLTIALLVILVILIIWLFYDNRYGIGNTVEIYATADGYKYKVHKAHDDHEDAANILAEIHRRITKLIASLKKKYPDLQNIKHDIDREKNNHIDIIPITSDEKLSHEHARLLIERYDPRNMTENSPLNAQNYTAYTENKGEVIAICLRAKDATHTIHDPNLIMFVVLHELAHVSNQTIGHDDSFWRAFKWLLQEAVEAGIYKPDNYDKTPQRYCGLLIDYNPLWDRKL